MYVKSNTLFASLGISQWSDILPHPIVIADSLLTPENMGALIRLSDNIGASALYFLGEENKKQSKLRRAAASSYENLAWKFVQPDNIRQLVPADYILVALETSEKATDLYQTVLPAKMAIVVGNERAGIRQAVLDQCDQTVYIPVPGPTCSLNVTHAAAVCLFEWLRQQISSHQLSTKG